MKKNVQSNWKSLWRTLVKKKKKIRLDGIKSTGDYTKTTSLKCEMGRKFLRHITVIINELVSISAPESLPVNLIEHFLHIFSKFLRISEIEVTEYDFWRTL